MRHLKKQNIKRKGIKQNKKKIMFFHFAIFIRGKSSFSRLVRSCLEENRKKTKQKSSKKKKQNKTKQNNNNL